MLFRKPEGMKYIIVEGNIGAGKSTFLRILEEFSNTNVVYEPLEKWQEGDLLDKFYADTKRWAYTFQTYAFVTRILAAEQAIRSSKKNVQILERSIYSDRYCFAKNAFESKVMSPLEWQLYTEWFDWLVDGYTVLPDGFIYMNTTPEVCFNRMKQRNRLEESKVSLDYLTSIHQKHEQWLIDKREVTSGLGAIPVLMLDCNKDFENNRDQQEDLIRQVSSFFPFFYQELKSFNADRPLSL